MDDDDSDDDNEGVSTSAPFRSSSGGVPATAAMRVLEEDSSADPSAGASVPTQSLLFTRSFKSPAKAALASSAAASAAWGAVAEVGSSASDAASTLQPADSSEASPSQLHPHAVPLSRAAAFAFDVDSPVTPPRKGVSATAAATPGAAPATPSGGVSKSDALPRTPERA